MKIGSELRCALSVKYTSDFEKNQYPTKGM